MKSDDEAVLELERARHKWAALRARIAAMKSMGLEQLTTGELEVLRTTSKGQEPEENRNPSEQ